MESPIVSAAAMRAAEEAAFSKGVEVEVLMDRAGAGVAAAVQKFFPSPGRALVFVGKGHNGGDALVNLIGNAVVCPKARVGLGGSELVSFVPRHTPGAAGRPKPRSVTSLRDGGRRARWRGSPRSRPHPLSRRWPHWRAP